MVCTTYLADNEVHKVTNKELKELLEEVDRLTGNKYVVQERLHVTTKRLFLIFEVQEYSTVYDVYYRYDSPSVQHMTIDGKRTFGSVYSYFLGLINGYKDRTS